MERDKALSAGAPGRLGAGGRADPRGLHPNADCDDIQRVAADRRCRRLRDRLLVLRGHLAARAARASRTPTRARRHSHRRRRQCCCCCCGLRAPATPARLRPRPSQSSEPLPATRWSEEWYYILIDTMPNSPRALLGAGASPHAFRSTETLKVWNVSRSPVSECPFLLQSNQFTLLQLIILFGLTCSQKRVLIDCTKLRSYRDRFPIRSYTKRGPFSLYAYWFISH